MSLFPELTRSRFKNPARPLGNGQTWCRLEQVALSGCSQDLHSSCYCQFVRQLSNTSRAALLSSSSLLLFLLPLLSLWVHAPCRDLALVLGSARVSAARVAVETSAPAAEGARSGPQGSVEGGTTDRQTERKKTLLSTISGIV